MLAPRTEQHVGAGAEAPLALDQLAAQHDELLARRSVLVHVRPAGSGSDVHDPHPDGTDAGEIPPEAARSDLHGRHLVNGHRQEGEHGQDIANPMDAGSEMISS